MSNKQKEKIVNKNFDLSVKFNSFLVSNPDVAAAIEPNSVVFFEVKKDPVFSKANENVAKVSCDEGKVCYRVEQTRGGWNINRVVRFA